MFTVRGVGALAGVLALACSAAAVEMQGTIDVILAVEPGSSGVPNLAGYEARLVLVPETAAITLLDAWSTDPFGPHPPIFPDLPPFVLPSGDGSLRVTGMCLSGSEKIEDGDGLFQAVFAVEPGALGTFFVTPDVDWTSLATELGEPIPYRSTPGQIIITQTSRMTTPVILTVPEPALLVLLGLGVPALCRRRR